MDWITNAIAIGTYLEAHDRDLLQRQGISSILSLDGSLQGCSPSNLGVQAITAVVLKDGPGNDRDTFLRAVNAVEHLARTHPPLLVQCHAGRSRSPIVVAGYLIKTVGIHPREALRRLAVKREINITEGMLPLLNFIEPLNSSTCGLL